MRLTAREVDLAKAHPTSVNNRQREEPAAQVRATAPSSSMRATRSLITANKRTASPPPWPRQRGRTGSSQPISSAVSTSASANAQSTPLGVSHQNFNSVLGQGFQRPDPGGRVADAYGQSPQDWGYVLSPPVALTVRERGWITPCSSSPSPRRGVEHRWIIGKAAVTRRRARRLLVGESSSRASRLLTRASRRRAAESSAGDRLLTVRGHESEQAPDRPGRRHCFASQSHCVSRHTGATSSVDLYRVPRPAGAAVWLVVSPTPEGRVRRSSGGPCRRIGLPVCAHFYSRAAVTTSRATAAGAQFHAARGARGRLAATTSVRSRADDGGTTE